MNRSGGGRHALGFAPKLLTRFALVGVAATLLYAAAALLIEAAGLGPVAASFAAYLIAAVFSYCGHKFLTFGSAGAHSEEAPRFAILTAAGFGLATAMPLLVTGLLGLPSAVSVAATCVLIPLVNLFVLERWVFRAARR